MHSKTTSRDLESPLVENLHRLVDIGLAAVLFVAPLAMAGRFASGRLLLILIIGLTAIAWSAARYLASGPQRWQVTGAEWLAGLAVLLVLVQVLPLPLGVVQTLSPSISELLPLHHGMQDVADTETPMMIGWHNLSLAPHATRGGLAMAVSYVLLFGVVSQRLRRRRDVELLLKAIALAGVSMATIGLLQRYLGNGKFLWFMEHPSRDTLTAVKGTFANENHFVHFLAMSLGPLLWWVVKEQGAAGNKPDRGTFSWGGVREQVRQVPRRLLLPLVGLVIVSLAALLSFSRGGLVMMALAGTVTLGLFAMQRRVGTRAIASLAGVVVVAAFCVWIHGQELLVRELESLQTTSIESLDQDQGRRKIWSAVLTAVPKFAILGSGVGSHRYVYPTFFKDRSSVQYTHAESGYLQVLLETGGVGFALLMVGIGLVGFWLLRVLGRGDHKHAFLAVPLVSCWSVGVVHAIFDFNWFIPANMCVTLLVAAASTRLSSIAGMTSLAPVLVTKRVNWAIVSTGIATVVILSVVQYAGPSRGHASFSEYKAWSLASNRFAAKSTGPGRQRSLGFVDPSLPETTERMIQLLDETVQQDPQHGRAHIRMAALCLRQFDQLQKDSSTGMELVQIRDAALSNEFASHQEMVDWVMRVAGENAVYLQRVLWHAKKGVQLTPTEGSGYLYLGEVAFLDAHLRGREHELLHQAYQVRPFDPSIQFVYGRHELLAGNQERAIELWKDAFRRSARVRARVIDAVATNAPVQEIVDVFQPDRRGLRDLFEYYRRAELVEPMRQVGGLYTEAIEREARLLSGEQAGKLWFDAQFVHATLGNLDSAVQAAENAVLAQPNEYKNHYACALRLRDVGRWEEAVRQFRWCQQRRPDNKELPLVISQLNQAARQARSSFQPMSPRSASAEFAPARKAGVTW